jgi:hypothetical protein
MMREKFADFTTNGPFGPHDGGAMAKASFNREAALLYAEMNKIKIKDTQDDDAIIVTVGKWVGTQDDTCDCKRFIKMTDRMCWFCGGDVSLDQNVPGGYEVMKEEWETRDEKKSEKKEKVEKKKEEDEDEEAEPEVEPEDLEPEAEESEDAEPEVEPEVEEPKKKKKEKEMGFNKLNLKMVKSSEDTEISRPAKKGEMSLDKKIEEICALNKQTGLSAWKIGKHLYDIKTNALYKQKNIETFEKFCETELPFTRASAYNFMRVSNKFDQEEAKMIGLSQLIKLASDGVSEKDRERLLKKAPEMDGETFAAELQEAVKEERERRGVSEPANKRKAASPYRHLVGAKVDGKYDKADPQKVVLSLDDDIFIELKILKTKVSAEFKKVEDDSAE